MENIAGQLIFAAANALVGFACHWGVVRTKLESIPKLEQKISDISDKYSNLASQFITQAEFERYSIRVDNSLQIIQSDIKTLLKFHSRNPD